MPQPAVPNHTTDYEQRRRARPGNLSSGADSANRGLGRWRTLRLRTGRERPSPATGNPLMPTRRSPAAHFRIPPEHQYPVSCIMSDSGDDGGGINLFADPDGYYPPEKEATFAQHTLLSGKPLSIRLVAHNPLWVSRHCRPAIGSLSLLLCHICSSKPWPSQPGLWRLLFVFHSST